MSDINDGPVALERVRHPPVPQIIECLEEMLAQAKRGEIQGLATAYVHTVDDGGTRFRWHMNPEHGENRLMRLHSVTHVMAVRMALDLEDGSDDIDDPTPHDNGDRDQ